MSQSNHRIKEPDTVHHLTSRIAHRVYFLKDDERNDFLSFVFRVTEFSGVKLLGWCIMTNHFHLLVYLPEPEALPDDEVRRRYDILKGIGANLSLKSQEEIEKQRHRMYNIADYMKMIKQWFSEDYNRRNGHKGTMWEATYGDVHVGKTSRAMAERLAYLHLNPVRAAITPNFDDYRWSSLTACMENNAIALSGMRFVYGPDMTDDEMFEYHKGIMCESLERWKFERAQTIARKRIMGYELPEDALTHEAQIVQAESHIKEIHEQLTSIQAERQVAKGAARKRELLERQILMAINANPMSSVQSLSDILGTPVPTIYQYLQSLKKRGVLFKEKRGAPWEVNFHNSGLT